MTITRVKESRVIFTEISPYLLRVSVYTDHRPTPRHVTHITFTPETSNKHRFAAINVLGNSDSLAQAYHLDMDMLWQYEGKRCTGTYHIEQDRSGHYMMRAE